MLNFEKLPALWEARFKVQDRFRPYMYVPFKPNSAQLDYLKLCHEAQNQRALTWIIAIKPRRVGLSRVISGIGTSMAWQTPGMQGMVMAQLGSTLGKIMTSIENMGRGLPGGARPLMGASSKGGREASAVVIGKGKNASTIIGAKALATGEGRGDAASFQQLDEAAHYPVNSPFTAVLPLVPRERNTFVGIVSTPLPERRGVPFREMWDNARWIHETRKDTLFIRYFCPWMKDPYAFDPNVRKDSTLLKFHDLDKDEKALYKAGVGLDQLAWRRQEIKGRYRGKKELFEQENPSDPLSCFTQTDLPAFSLEERSWARQTVVNPPPIQGFLESANRAELPIYIRAHERGDWRIYEEPQKRCEYYIGVDGARGIDVMDKGDEKSVTDFTAVVIVNGTTEAVAAVLETKMPPDRVALEIAKAGKLYQTREISQYHYAMLNIAITDGYGNEIQRRLIHEYGYPVMRFARWKGRDDKIVSSPTRNIGWIDTMSTNQMRLDVFRIALANQRFLVRDIRLAEQIQAASLTPTGDAEDYRGHDDVLDATMYAWIARDMYRPRELIDPDMTQTIQTPALLKIANDPAGHFQKVWSSLNQMARPQAGDHVGQVLEHINNPRIFS